MKSLVKQRGVTLVELMISITIGLLIIAGVFQLYLTSTQTQKTQNGLSRIQENMRYLFTKMEADITQTGYFGCIPFQGGADDDALIKVHLTKDITTTYDFASLLGGENDTGIRNSDILRTRYFSAAAQLAVESPGMASLNSPVPLLSTNPMSNPIYANLKKGDVVMVSDCSFADVFMITSDPANDGLIYHDNVTSVDGQSNLSADLQREYGKPNTQTGSAAYLYSGSSAAVEWKLDTSASGKAEGELCSDTNPQFCAIFRNDEEMAEGIQDFQVRYGWRNAANNLLVDTADKVTDWNAVDRVVVTLTLNSVQPAPSIDGSKYISKEVSKIFMLRNQLPGEI